MSFYQRKEVKDLLAYFRLVINPLDEDAFLRIVNFPARGIGQTTINKLLAASNESEKPLWAIASQAGSHQLGLNSGTLGKLEQFVTLIKGFEAQLFRLNAFELGEKIVNQSGIRKFYFDEGSPESLNRRENIEEVLAALKEFVRPPEETEEVVEPDAGPRTLDEFMQDIALLTDADIKIDDDNDRNKVSLMTIHAAKGLEFPYVFIAGVEENLFPSQLSINSRQELEEERRLFYVALTRAMELATISYAETRFRYGNFTICEPSRFIDELDSQFIDYLIPPAMRKKPPIQKESFRESLNRFKKIADSRNPDFISPSPGNPKKGTQASETTYSSGFAVLSPDMLRLNMRVVHPRFGTGTVKAIEGNAQTAKATVEFSQFGTKQLLLKFARLKIIDE